MPNNSAALDILAAIDGTDSENWIERSGDGTPSGGNSHVHRFHADFLPGPSPANVQFKQYFAGPNKFGDNVEAIVEAVKLFVRQRLKLAPHARVNFVGHSRGGLIAILAAKQLKIPVHFIGLYDAVDRHVGPRAQVIPANVGTVYHAVRDPSTHSRMWFGNCGRKHENPESYHERAFEATHGGIGGDSKGAHKAEARDTLGWTAIATGLKGPIAGLVTYNAIKVRVDLNKDLEQGSRADRFIRVGARSVGLRIAG